ncbi:hypothetical protein O181_003816 [Austropuccinia psidii MF-1]|uniref:Uncharacterized protein n=1 Tax=Austropuccinia psidii MF-1 TaxID=1389203 RepID=A0A9Q3BEC5_9BASI|nr:hypothetical protein [Austropuccinia psidii MF-1]
MVHTRNRSKYSVQTDGSGQGRGKNRARPSRPSSRKEYFEDARVSPHSPRSVPTSFDISYEPELIHGTVLRVEALPSGNHTYISVPVQKMVQRSQGRGVENMPKPLAGGYELLLTCKELSGSEEDHRTLMRIGSIVLQRQD